MATGFIYQGFASTGPVLLTQEPYISSGARLYVDSTTGSDSNGGTNPALPKATVFGASGALSVATTGASDLVVCAAAHRETISSAYSWTLNGVTLVSHGSGTARAQFTSAVAGVAITVSGNANRIVNCYFPASSAATTSRITASGSGNLVHGCEILAGASDNTDQILLTGSYNTVASCTVTVSAVATGTTRRGIRLNGTTTGNSVLDCTLNGSSFGWSDVAFKLDDANSDMWRVERLTLSNKSFLQVTASGLKGYVSGVTCDVSSGIIYLE